MISNHAKATSIFECIDQKGTIRTGDGNYTVTQGILDAGEYPGDVWRISNPSNDKWLKQVESKTALRFSDIGKVHVGVKTTADKVFIRKDWNSFPPEKNRKFYVH